MAPDRGLSILGDAALNHPSINTDDSGEAQDLQEEVPEGSDDENRDAAEAARRRSEARQFLTERAGEGQNFTVRGVLVGLAIGVIICFSNMYFGLQTGWISGMAMPSALIGFAFFKTVARHIDYPFTPVENVLVQTVAGALGTMPLGCGFVGVMPALEYMLTPEENGPLVLGTWKLIVWSVGICFFGVFFAVPLRREVIIREKLKFPSGTATALMIGVLHGKTDDAGLARHESAMGTFRRSSQDLLRPGSTTSGIPFDEIEDARSDQRPSTTSPEAAEPNEQGLGLDEKSDWKAKIRLMIVAFAISAIYTLVSFFIPQLRNLPILGLPLARNWLWTLNPSPAYIGQGIIMGPATTLHMLLGAAVGWGVLSPLAKNRGWAPGAIEDWAKGSKGWIVWVSLAIMLADSVVSLGWLTIRPLLLHIPHYYAHVRDLAKTGGPLDLLHFGRSKHVDYTAVASSEPPTVRTPRPSHSAQHQATGGGVNDKDLPDVDAPPEHLVSNRTVVVGLILSIIVCIIAVHVVFGDLVPLYATVTAVILALLLSIMGVRALGETDLNPVSGISKVTQLFFALIIPASNKNSVIINLLAGAISESGAVQAGDMMQDLKTGHLLGAAPKAQFYGQLIGSFVGAVVSAWVYKLYTSVYEIPGGMFQVPTGFVWLFTAKLVTGQGLPPMAWQWALGAGVLFAATTGLRIYGHGTRWQAWVPGGIAVAVGMYNVPSFTLARAIGGLLNWYWQSYRRREETPVIVVASGLILGEGVVSIVNLLLSSLKFPHL